MGVGKGVGSGRGESGVIGSALAIVLVVVMCTFGIPLLFIGIAFVAIGFNHNAGLAILIVSAILTALAIGLIILICTGVLGKKSQTGIVLPQSTVSYVGVSTQQQVLTYPPSSQEQPPAYVSTQQSPPTYVNPQQSPPANPANNQLYEGAANPSSSTMPYPPGNQKT